MCNTISLRPCHSSSYTGTQLEIIKLCKILDSTKLLISKNYQNSKNIKNIKKTNRDIEIVNKRNLMYSFVYTNLKRIDIVKPIEEFDSDSEEEEYFSDLEF
jgi:hypothetical protein